jgi:hypothetical protein
MDHTTHTVLLWFVAGMGVTAFVLWLTMVAASEGERLGPEIDRMLGEPRVAAAEVERAPAADRSPGRAEDRFRRLGDPEYGLFLEGESSVSAA